MSGNTYIFGSVIKLKNLATDPASGEAGSIYFNTAVNKLRVYASGSWSDVTSQHNGLSGIQGGLSDEYYHLSAGEYTGTGSGVFVRKTGAELETPVALTSVKVAQAASPAVTEIELDAAAKSIVIKSGASTATTISAAATTGNVSFKLPATNGSAGQVLTTDGSGNLSYGDMTTELTGKALTEGSIIVGNSSNQSAAVDTFTQGDISVDVNGLHINNEVISDMHISATAAISREKIAVGTPSRILINGAFGEMAENAALTANRAITSNVDGLLVHSAVTSTELGYVSGVTSSIQTQIDGKLSLGGGSMTGNIAMNNNRITGLAAPIASNDAVRLLDLQNVEAGLDFQKDVNDYIADASTTAAPAAVTGDRYILASGTASLHVSWGTIAGVGNNDIVQYNGTSWFVAYDVSAKGAGALTWNTAQVYWMRWNGTSWDEFGGLSGINAGIGLEKTGNTLNVLLGAGIQELPTDEVGIDLYGSSSGLMLTVDGTTESTNTAAKLAAKVDNDTIERSSSGLKVKDGGIADLQIASDAAITLSKLAALTANRAVATNASGVLIASSATATELGYLSGVTSAIQTQINGKAATDLSNLLNTAVNTDLNPAGNGAQNLGNGAVGWASLNLYSNSTQFNMTAESLTSGGSFSIDAANTLQLTGASTAGTISINSSDISFNHSAKIASHAPIHLQTDGMFGFGSNTAHLRGTLAASTSTFTTLASFDPTVIGRIGYIEYWADETSGHSRSGKIHFARNSAGVIGWNDAFAESGVIGNGVEMEISFDTGLMRIKAKGSAANQVAFQFVVVGRQA